MTKNWEILAGVEKIRPTDVRCFSYVVPKSASSWPVAIACELFSLLAPKSSPNSCTASLQVNKKTEQNYIHLLNGEEKLGLKWEFIERSMKYVRLSVPFLFIDFSGFRLHFCSFLLAACTIAVNTPRSSLQRHIALFRFHIFPFYFFLGAFERFHILSLFFIISFLQLSQGFFISANHEIAILSMPAFYSWGSC